MVSPRDVIGERRRRRRYRTIKEKRVKEEEREKKERKHDTRNERIAKVNQIPRLTINCREDSNTVYQIIITIALNNTNNNRTERRKSRFFTISSLRRDLSPTCKFRWSWRNREHSRATYRALITCDMSCATRYEGTAQLISLTELKSHLF